MLSACDDTNLLMKGISHGACDYLLKPVRLEELRNIWQHVVRRNKSGVVWSVELHRKFVAAVNHLSIDSMFSCSSLYVEQFFVSYQFPHIIANVMKFFIIEFE